MTALMADVWHHRRSPFFAQTMICYVGVLDSRRTRDSRRMQRENIIAQVAAHQGELEQFGVRKLALFGSAARGDARPDSDLDFLVDFEGPATFDRYMGLKLYLEDLLLHKVDLVTEKSLKTALRGNVEADLIRVA